MKGALPPSSKESFFTVEELCFMSKRPTSVEPVKVILLTSGLEVSSPPISLELPVKTLKTPAGIPARSANAASARAEYGVDVAGLATIVHPEAQTRAALPAVISAGKIHGGVTAQNPNRVLFTTRGRALHRR